MHENGPRCKVEIEHDGTQLNVFRLIELTRSADVFLLRFINADGESHLMKFHSNRDVDAYRGPFEEVSRCHFSGFFDSDYSSISSCSLSQFGGIVSVNRKRFVLGAEDNGTFYLLPVEGGDCSFNSKRTKRDSSLIRAAPYYSDYLDGKKRFVEFAFIADYSIYEKYTNNATAVHERLQTIANHMNALYQPLNIRVILVWVDIWTGTNPITVQANSDETLRDFLIFRKTFNNLHHNDNAHLLTNVRFANNVVGKAYKGTMCSFDHSGGVNMDHHAHAAFVAATIAHEMGHNFGMDHDTNSVDCKCESVAGCIMAPASGGYSPPTFWSECSLVFLQKSISHGLGDACLFDQPKEVYGGARCGNSILEEGEECDCGSTVSCSNKCCDPKTCKLVAGAKCATGDCCDLEICKIKPATTRCRDSTNSCDLPEYCDGQTPHCPSDFYVQDGLPCPGDPEDYCYDGHCGNRDAQCKMIWGPTGRNAESVCYQLNIKGGPAGNCGYNADKNVFIPCKPADKLCGRLQCDHANEKHEMSVTYSLQQAYSTIKMWNQKNAVCRVAFTKYKKPRDPGLVMNGAACGEDMFCVNSKCKNRTQEIKMVPRCSPENCNNAGICNNMGNCHCKTGYGGVDCAIPGNGGSVNSGPASEGGVFPVGLFVFCLLVALLIAFCIATYFLKRRKNIWLPKEIWRKIKNTFNIRRMLVPVRKAPPPPPAAIRAADLNAMWGDNQPERFTKQNYKTTISAPVIPSDGFSPNSIQPLNGTYSNYNSRTPELQTAEKPFGAYYGGPALSGGSFSNGQSQASSNYVKRQNSSASNVTRPTLPPPVPPAPSIPSVASAPPIPAHKKDSSTCATSKKPVVKKKPPLPSKPVVASKSSVKDLAARFDTKTAQLMTTIN